MTPLFLAALLLAPPSGEPAEAPRHPYHEPQHARAPAELWAVVEIPRDSPVKYEIDKVTGHLVVDRFQSMPVTAPANYGSFPSTVASDGDPLDVVLLSRYPVQAGAFIRVRPVGVMRTLDGEDPDDKILVVPVSAVDPAYDGIQDVNDVPAAERDRIAAYFRVYKQLPNGIEGRIVEVGGRQMAERLVKEAMARYGAVERGSAP